MIRLFLCKARRQNRSIVNLCEDFDDRRLVQKELIRTICLRIEGESYKYHHREGQ